MTPICLQTLDLLRRAQQLMDDERRHIVAAHIAMAIDALSGDQGRVEQTGTR